MVCVMIKNREMPWSQICHYSTDKANVPLNLNGLLERMSHFPVLRDHFNVIQGILAKYNVSE